MRRHLNLGLGLAEFLRALAVAKSGAEFGGDVADYDRLAAVLAGELGVGDLAAGVVAQHDRGAFGACEVRVTPAHERHDGGKKVASGVGQPVLVAVGIVGVLDPLEQAGIDQRPQASGEGGPWNVEVAGELSVASYAEERLAHDQHRPALAEERGRTAFAPEVVLPDQRGDEVWPSALLRSGPVALVFYRGESCPYCNLQLRTFQAHLALVVALLALVVGGRPLRSRPYLSARLRKPPDDAAASDTTS